MNISHTSLSNSITEQIIQKERNDFHEHRLKQSLDTADYVIKYNNIVSILTSHSESTVGFSRNYIINPINRYADDRLGSTVDALSKIEFLLQSFQLIAAGTSLIFRHHFLSNSEQLLQLLEKSIKDKDDINIQMSLAQLKGKINSEKTKLMEDAKKYGISTGSSLPSTTSTILDLAEKSTSASSLILGWTGGVISALVDGYELNNADKTLTRHKKFCEKIERIAKERCLPEDPKQVLSDREKLKNQLRELAVEKHRQLGKYLEFEHTKRKAKFVVSTLLSLSLLALQTAAIVVAIGSFILIPQFALLGASIVFIAVGAYYWATNRPNLFKATVANYFHSTYYSIRNYITVWLLARAKLEFMDLNSQRIDWLARQSLSPQTAEKEALVQHESKHEALKKEIEQLEKDASYWRSKQDTIKADLLNAEFADMNRGNDARFWNMHKLISTIKEQINNFNNEDKDELKNILGLDLDELNENSSEIEFRDRLLGSHLGTSEVDLKDL